MRVFVTLDDKLYRTLQDRALKRGMSFQEVINEALSRGVSEAVGSPGSGGPDRPKASRQGARRSRGKTSDAPRSFDDLLDEL